MTEYNNENRGVLFQNTKKETEKHPDYTGELNVEGKEYWISGWKKVSKNGNPFVSLSIKPKEPAGNQQKAAQSPQRVDESFDDEIPFN